jgi:hypothetical protein
LTMSFAFQTRVAYFLVLSPSRSVPSVGEK